MSTTPRLSRTAARARAIRPARATRGIRHLRTRGAPRLVVDTIGHRPRLAWAVTTGGRRADGTPSRMTSYVDARTGTVLRREEDIETVDGSGQSLYSGTVPLKLTQSGSTYQLKDPTRGNTYTNDVNNKADSIFCHALRGQLPGRHHVHQLDPDVRQRHQQQPRVGRRRRAVRHQRDLGLLQPGARPQRHLRQRHRLLQPRPLRLELRQRLLGRHQDDLRRRRRGQLRPARLAGRGRPRDVARRHREHRQPDLLRRVRRPQRVHLGHLRHDGGVLRQQRERPGRLPDR